MDTLQITLAGRWRAGVTLAAGTSSVDAPEGLRDHIGLRLGELSLTAHLGDDAVLPFLQALAGQLAALPEGETARVPLAPSGHHLHLTRQRGRLLVSFLTETGRPVVRNAPADFDAVREAVRTVGESFVAELLDARPAWARLAAVRALRRSLAGLDRQGPRAPEHEGRGGASGTPARARRAPPADFPLTVTEAGIRLGAQPASGDPGAGRRGTLQRLFDAVESLAREPGRKAGVPWSTSPRTTLHLERATPGLLNWTLRDALAPWMSGQARLTSVLLRLRAAAAAMPEFDPVEARFRLAAIRRWLRAESLPPLLGGPLPPAPSLAPTTPPPVERPGLEARRLVHVAFRRLWRRALERFFLPVQRLDGDSILVHTAEGVRGLSRETGRERWRRTGAHPLLAGGPADVLLDARGRLMRIDADTGETLWREPRAWRRPPAVAVQLDALGLVVMTESGELVALDSEGRRRFSTRLLAGTAHGLTVGPALIWAAGEDAHLSAFRRADGALHFRVPLNGHAVGAPLDTRGGLVAVVERGPRAHVLTFDSATGRLRADQPLPGQVLSVQLVGAGQVPKVAVQTLTEEGTLTHVLDETTGRRCFALPLGPGRATLTSYQGLICLGGDGGRVSAYDAGDGAPIWAQAGDEGADDPALHVRPLGVRGLLYVLGSTLRVLDPATGRVVSRHGLDGFEVGSWLVSPEGDVLLADAERALLYLRLSGHLSRVD